MLARIKARRAAPPRASRGLAALIPAPRTAVSAAVVERAVLLLICGHPADRVPVAEADSRRRDNG